MSKGPALALALLMVCLPGMLPSGSAGPTPSQGLSPSSGASQEFVYTPFAEDARAFFFRFRTENAACVSLEVNVTMDFFQRTPFLQAEAHGVTHHIPGVGSVDRLVGWGAATEFENDPKTSHLMVNGTAAYYYNETGYDGTSNRAFQRSIATTCGSTTEPSEEWRFYVATATVQNATARLSFYESWTRAEDGVGFNLVAGNATGTVHFVSESNRTFLRQLKDFDGTVSYNGDPFGLGVTPSAAAANVETTITTTRGFSGGFLDLAAKPGGYNEASLLSYEGPAGERGAGTDVVPGSPFPKLLLLHVAGGPGDWTFRAHAYAAPRSFSSLLVWGADIETRTPNPNLDTVDADRDGVPDKAEYPLCLVQDDNRPVDGDCPGFPDYEPTPGAPNPRRL